MTLKVVGSSIKNELVECFFCSDKFVWLNVYEYGFSGSYQAECRQCRLKLAKKKKDGKS